MFKLSINHSDKEDIKEFREELFKVLHQINSHNFATTQRLDRIEEFCQAIFPSDTISIQQQKRESLAKVYANYLAESEGLSLEDGLTRARFEVLKFDNQQIFRKLNKGILKKEEKVAEANFYNSNIIEKDIEGFWTLGNSEEKWIAPYHLFAPIYRLIKEHEYEEGQYISINSSADRNYYSFIKNRAIARNLEKLGIISKVPDKGESRNIGNQNYKLNLTDLSKIGEIIYEGPRKAHDDSFFDGRLKAGSIEDIFRIEL